MYQLRCCNAPIYALLVTRMNWRLIETPMAVIDHVILQSWSIC
jgi:hypothetical protein